MVITSIVQFRDLSVQAFGASEPNAGWPARPQYQARAGDGAVRLNGSERGQRDARNERRRWTLIGPSAAALDDTYAALLNQVAYPGRLVGMTASGLALWTDAELLDVRAVGPPRALSGRLRGVGLEVDTEWYFPTPDWFAEQQQVLTFSDFYDADAESDLLLMDVSAPAPGTLIPMTWDIQGAAWSRHIVITLTSGTGTVTRLLLENTTTGYTIDWNGTLASGDELVIDVDAERITADGTAAYDELTLGNHTAWFRLANGANAVTVLIDDTATDESTVLRVAYYPTYP